MNNILTFRENRNKTNKKPQQNNKEHYLNVKCSPLIPKESLYVFYLILLAFPLFLETCTTCLAREKIWHQVYDQSDTIKVLLPSLSRHTNILPRRSSFLLSSKLFGS